MHTPAPSPHACDTSHAVCACGRRWEYLTSSPGESPRYTSAAVIDRYGVLYGAHPSARRVSTAAEVTA